jgi:predicted nucleotidyltransferase
MDSIRRVAAELAIPERTLRRSAAAGLVRGRRVSQRRFEVTLREEAYLRTHWELLRALRRALRTERNVRAAVLFGSVAVGSDEETSDIDILVDVRDPDVRRLADVSDRLSRALSRDVQLVRLSEAVGSPALMRDVLEQGRVLVDRDGGWARLQRWAPRWRREARRAERSSVPPLEDLGR